MTLSDEQAGLVDAVDRLLARRAGPERARELGGDHPRYDHELEEALAAAGFLDCARDPDAGPLAAALVTEQTARAAGVASVGARALVATLLAGELADLVELAPPIALVVAAPRGPVRFAADARTLLVAGDHGLGLVPLRPGAIEPAASRFGYPTGTVPASIVSAASIVSPTSAHPIGPADGKGGGGKARLVDLWRVSLAAELVGTMAAALDVVLGHVKTREQFGKPIGSFQALQHRLAEVSLLIEGSRFLTLEAAWRSAETESAAVALTNAVTAARRVLVEAHQMTGALGFTTEFDLHLWTMRLPALITEADSLGDPAAAVTAARWLDRV